MENIKKFRLREGVVRIANGIKSKPLLAFVILFALVGAISLVLTRAAFSGFTGELKHNNTSNTHTINVEAPGLLTASLTDLTKQSKSKIRYKLALNDASNKTISHFESAKVGEGITFSEEVSAGEYKFVVSSVDEITPGPPVSYALDVNYPDPAAPDPVDTKNPVVSFHQPNSDDTVGSVFTVSGASSDESGVAKVDYRFKGGSWKTAQGTTSWSGQLDSTSLQNGPATLEARSYDKLGNVGTASIQVQIYNEQTGEDDPLPPPSVTGSSIWISNEEIMKLPMSGTAWGNLKSTATGGLGSVRLDDNNSSHDTNVLALAYYAVRTNSSSDINKVVAELATVPGSPRSRALEFCRNITSYVIAADVINLTSVNSSEDKRFKDFIRYWVIEDETLQGHSGKGIKGTASRSSNNWGGMCRAAYAATARYLGDSTALNNVGKWHKGFLGDTATYNGLSFNSTNWHADSSNKKGINAKGATIQGHNVDGVLPEDQRRTGDFEWPAPKGSYPWEGLQGALVADVILQRAGLLTPDYQDAALTRAYKWLYAVNDNPAEGDDRWQVWVINKLYGTNYPTETGVSAGKLMGWTDWTHQ